MKRVALILFYLVLLLLPTQLGKHFFFSFSLIQGIRSDYLTPTIYLTDILIISLIILTFFQAWKREFLFDFKKLYIFVLLYLFINTIAADNKWIAIYQFGKIIEYFLFALSIMDIKPKLKTIVRVLSIDVFYASIIAFGQFYLQKSIGGFFWFLGERNFYASTPGIANISVVGAKFLRHYSVPWV